MVLREDIEKREYKILSPFATKAASSLGRLNFEDKCPYRTEFQRDRDRIIHSKSFRRLMHKTQVFLSPEGDHFRTRLTHTLEVAQIARTIAKSLALNEDLTEAIAMGHDLGHTPFGHNGEDFLNQRHINGFQHNVQSLRIADSLESNGSRRGINLTKEVRDGILNHTGDMMPFTLEGKVVRYSDRIAYINHDIDDALRSGVINEFELPKDCVGILGKDHRSRINTLVNDLIVNSDKKKDNIIMSEEKLFYMNKLRSFMFENVYHNKKVKKDEELNKIKNMIFCLYDYYEKDPDKLPIEWHELLPQFGIQEVIKDHIAGMTDRYAVNLFQELFVPKGWK